MASFIWTQSRLEELLNHSQAGVRRWAVVKLSALYPRRFRELLPELLQDEHQEVVQTSLGLMDEPSREDLVAILKELYLTGSESISAKAIQVLGNWRTAGAVAWMRERILGSPPLGREQIAAMIQALGRIPGEDAYSLLKDTERAVRDKDSSHWRLFYAALLEHRKPEDVVTLLNVVLDGNCKEERRRDALGLLLAQVDPMLNPSDVFFGNRPAVTRHLARRAADLRAAAAADAADLLEALQRAVDSLEGDDSQSVHEFTLLQRDLLDGGECRQFENAIVSHTIKGLDGSPGGISWRYGLCCLAWSALAKMLEGRFFPPPAPQAQWQQKLQYLLGDRLPQSDDESLQAAVLAEADRRELVARLSDHLQNHPTGWGTARCLILLGRLGAAETTAMIVALLKDLSEEWSVEAAKSALLQMGADAVGPLLTRLSQAQMREKHLILEILAQLPTEESVQTVAPLFASLYAENAEGTLKVAYDMGAKEFLPVIEHEYRPGEWDLGRVYVHLCQVNRMHPSRLAEIERDVARGDAFMQESRRVLSDRQAHWPSFMQLELACRNCGKKYQYQLREVHQHPHDRLEPERAEKDFTPYRQGIVIVDDVRCKNCQTLNRFELTPASFAQITTESFKLLAFQKMNRQPPPHYPFKHVRLEEREGQPLSLLDVEREHLEAVRLQPSRPAVHLACGKFYEYIKDYPSARRFYLQAIDLDARAVEGMAGLVRLDHAEGKMKEASEWVQACYDNLDKGNFYLTGDIPAFKAMVRQKRKEFARELGIKAEEKPIEIRFRFDAGDYPKNKPCPCGSGKKYKLCCMR